MRQLLRTSIFLGAMGALLLGTSSAAAQEPHVLTIAKGIGGGTGTNGGAGNEQPTVVSVTDEKGDRYVVVISMSSDVDAAQGLDPWQCKCSSVRLSPTAPPEVVVDQVLLTQNTNTNRPCNHPFAATDGKRIVWAHGHNKNNGTTQTYVQAIDAMCKPQGDTYMISDGGKNAQQGAPEIRHVSGDRFIAGYYYDGDDDHTYARGLTLNADSSIVADYRVAAVDDNSIGRPAIATYGEKALVCASKGDQRPPEVGVACAWINAIDGTVYWLDRVVAPSIPADKVFMNQPSLAPLGGGRFVLHVIESSGGQENKTNVKGSSKVHLYVLEPNDSDEGLKAKISNVGIYQTHSAVISGKYGEKGETFVGLFEAPITGSGVPAISFLSYDASNQKFNPLNEDRDQWVVGANVGDSGKIANLNGANPGKQGRDFMRGIGDVPNPGAEVNGGWKAEVKSFFVLPYAGMRNGEDKNALFLSFVPGETVNPPDPPPPPPPPDAGGTGGSDSSGNPGASPPAGSPTSCACGVPGGSSSNQSAWATLLGAGLALALLRRRH